MSRPAHVTPGRLRRHLGMRIAIVGGTGTLGGHLTAELASRGHEVRVLSRTAPEYPVDLRHRGGPRARAERLRCRDRRQQQRLAEGGRGPGRGDPAVAGRGAGGRGASSRGRVDRGLRPAADRLLPGQDGPGEPGRAGPGTVDHRACHPVPRTGRQGLRDRGPVPGAARAARAAAADRQRRGRALRRGRGGAAAAAGTARRRGTRGRRAAHAGPYLAVGHRPRVRGAPRLPARPGRPGPARTGTLTTGEAESRGRVSFSAWLEAGAGAAVTARGGPVRR